MSTRPRLRFGMIIGVALILLLLNVGFRQLCISGNALTMSSTAPSHDQISTQETLSSTLPGPTIYLPIIQGEIQSQSAAEDEQQAGAEDDHSVHLPVLLDELAPASSDKVLPADMQLATAVTNRPWQQLDPDMVYEPASGQYLVIWEDQYNNSSDYDIYARRLDAGGVPITAEFKIVNSTQVELNPAIALNPSGPEYLVVWEQVNSGQQHSLYAQRINAAGTALGSPIPVDTLCAVGVECMPDVTFNTADEEYLVVWRDDQDPDGDHVMARRISASGSTIGAAQDLAFSESLGNPVVAHNPNLGQYLVVWQERHWIDNRGLDIYGIRVNTLAAPIESSAFAISTATYDQILPRLAVDTVHGDYLVVWEDHRWSAGADADIYGQRVSGYGSLIHDNFRVSEDTAKRRFRPDVAYKSEANEFLAVWEYEFSSTDLDIQMRRLSYYGSLLKNEVALAQSLATERAPVIAAGGGKSYLAVWEDSRDQATQGINLYDAVAAVDTFSGHVYEGNLGDSSQPLAGVTVALYASNSTDVLGELLSSTTTDSTGYYELIHYACDCDMLHLLESDPTGYISVGSQSGGGFVVNSNQIRYFYPAYDEVLSGNDFWDKLEPPVDPDPPANWANFSPAEWVNTQTIVASVRVEDTQSGLEVGSAQYAFSTDGGATWSAWLPATCTGVDGTTSPQVITTPPISFGQDAGQDGNNRVRFRIADMAQPQKNVGTSSSYAVAVDTVLPQNPTSLTCPSHTVGTWSNNNLLACQWTAGSDQGSGLLGYVYEWNHEASSSLGNVPTTPGLTITSYPLPESMNWHFHLRAVDLAGNIAPTTLHQGPYRIDATAPTSEMAFLSSSQFTTAFSVQWSGDPGYGSPIAGFDVKVRDQYEGNSQDSVWKSATTATSALFTGQRGHTYSFFTRARDLAGNVEAYPAMPDAQTTVGAPIQVFVRDANASSVRGADVIVNGALAGYTDTSGRLTLPQALSGDRLFALNTVYYRPAVKANHGLNGVGNWAWRVYQSSFGLDARGEPVLATLTSPARAVTLVLRGNQAVVGVHLVVSVEWDASAAYLSDLQQGLENASMYLYDVGDSQYFLQTIEVFDNKVRWYDADMRIYASNQQWPMARLWGVMQGADAHIHLGRHFDGQSANSGSWLNSDGFRTMIHEFGHYGLGLDDEYLDRDGNQSSAELCATNFWSVLEPLRASIMNNQYSATELCSEVDPNHRHSTNTLHDKNYGESTWETVSRRFADSQTPARWTILTPDDRGAIMAGPSVLPMPEALKVYVTDSDTTVCTPFTLRWLTEGNADDPTTDADVTVDRPNGADIYQGKTDAKGEITIYGAHTGDTVQVYKSTGWFSSISGSHQVDCANLAAANERVAVVPVQPNPFDLVVAVSAISTSTIQIDVTASTALSANPTARVWQDGPEEAIDAPLAPAASEEQFVGQATLNADLGLRGVVEVTALDNGGRRVTKRQPFVIEPIIAQRLNAELFSSDGNFRLVLVENTLPSDALLSMQGQSSAVAPPAGLIGASGVYKVIITPNQPLLQKPAGIHIRYAADEMVHVDPASLRIYRLDETVGTWTPLETSLDAALQLVSARTEQVGTFTVFARPAGLHSVYLPLIQR